MSTEDNENFEATDSYENEAVAENASAAAPASGGRPSFNSNNMGGARRPNSLGSRGFRPASGGPAGDGPAGDGPAGDGRSQVRRPRRPMGKDRFSPRRKVCQFCVDKIREVDYKDFQRLRGRYLSDRGKIEPRRKTGTCARHQRSLTTALKRARYMALLPYVAAHTR